MHVSFYTYYFFLVFKYISLLINTVLLFEHIQLIFYESPTYGAHHFSLDVQNSFKQVKDPLRKPKWVDELHQTQPIFGMVKELLRFVFCA